MIDAFYHGAKLNYFYETVAYFFVKVWYFFVIFPFWAQKSLKSISQ